MTYFGEQMLQLSFSQALIVFLLFFGILFYLTMAYFGEQMLQASFSRTQ
jgi:hypothetical protein